MNLQEIRRKFRDLSGRFDLVNDDFSDNGADFFINEASKWLDKTAETTKTWASYKEIITAGTWNVQFPSCRAIKEVWLATDEGRWQLEKRRLQDILEGYYYATPAEIDTGTSLYYAPTVTRHIPEDITAVTLATFEPYVEVLTPTGYTYNAILLSVPVDRDTLVDVKGLFHSVALSDDDDENYWSVVHPLLLIQAAMRISHIVTGNRPLLDITDRGLDGDLNRLEKDLVEQMIAEIDQMEG